MASNSASGGLDWTVRKNYFTERLIKHWKRLLNEVVNSSFLQGLKRCGGVVLRDMAQWRVCQSWVHC